MAQIKSLVKVWVEAVFHLVKVTLIFGKSRLFTFTYSRCLFKIKSLSSAHKFDKKNATKRVAMLHLLIHAFCTKCFLLNQERPSVIVLCILDLNE